MKLIGITMRVATESSYSERRDALDQRWGDFFRRCGLTPVLLPNNVAQVRSLLKKIKLQGYVLSGGNDLKRYGGDVPERDAVERLLLRTAVSHRLPVIGVCRGMQALQEFYGIRLARVRGHVMKRQKIFIDGKPETVNSYHNWGSAGPQKPLAVWASAFDGVVKAVSHPMLPLHGIMWHPERLAPFRKSDIAWFQRVFGA